MSSARPAALPEPASLPGDLVPSTLPAPHPADTQGLAEPELRARVPALEPAQDLVRPALVDSAALDPVPAEHRPLEKRRVRSVQPREAVAVVRSIQRPRKAR